MDNKTQCDEILNHLSAGYAITPLEALKFFGCFRLGARIYDLKKRGYRIGKEMRKTETGKRVACYYREDLPVQVELIMED